MPTYDYRCKECSHEFEIVQSISDDALQTCPECGGPLVKKFSAVGISFKGSGFYKNDSRSSSPKKSSPTSGNAEATTPAPATNESKTATPATPS